MCATNLDSADAAVQQDAEHGSPTIEIIDPVSDRAWYAPLLFFACAGRALLLYLSSLAPSITWAHQGADSGELIAAAVVNGVPHPPGYPLYTILLRLWLAAIGFLAPATDLGWRGNLLSATLGALSVGLTGITVAHLLRLQPGRWLWAFCAAMAWTISPLMWSQAVITEVYALHAVVLALLGWVALGNGHRYWLLAAIVGIGIANHLTILFLLPAVIYLLWSESSGKQHRTLGIALVAGIAVGALFYLRTPVAAAGAPIPAVNWGYADNVEGFWWLVSGQAYRSYLFGVPRGEIFGRITAWANTIVSQLTPIGLGVALLGLAEWDHAAPRLRNFALLWTVPVSLYSMIYYTRDSDIYLLPVSWMLTVLFGVGLASIYLWLRSRVADRARLMLGLTVGLAAFGLLALTVVRYGSISLTTDSEATEFLRSVVETVEPGSIIVTGQDNETFALWFGAWGSGELTTSAPDTVLVNHALYQFPWYQRLMGDLYPHVSGADKSAETLIFANADERPVYLTEPLPGIDPVELIEDGPLWRYAPRN